MPHTDGVSQYHQVPWQLLEAVGKLRPLPAPPDGRGQQPPVPWRALELGCGSGLCGRLFHPYCQDG